MLGALTSLTGGGGLSASSSNTATSGDARGGSTSGSGISSPVVIGGFKSNGGAATGFNPIWVFAAVVAVGLFLHFRKK
jgi:uncharacterized membrane protein